MCYVPVTSWHYEITMGELLVKEIAVDVDKPRLHVKCKEVGEDSVKTV